MYNIKFSPNFVNSLKKIQKENLKLSVKILSFILEVSQNPFSGTGKPEQLRGNLSGFYSRRITKKHRLIYKVENKTVMLFSCYGHYID